jgi:hypothetical protein
VTGAKRKTASRRLCENSESASTMRMVFLAAIRNGPLENFTHINRDLMKIHSIGFGGATFSHSLLTAVSPKSVQVLRSSGCDCFEISEATNWGCLTEKNSKLVVASPNDTTPPFEVFAYYHKDNI